jgi:hypothetical protein
MLLSVTLSDVVSEPPNSHQLRNRACGTQIPSPNQCHRSFPSLESEGYNLEAKKFDVKEHPEHLKWLHTVISNLKSFVSGTFHGLDSRHLQRYLDDSVIALIAASSQDSYSTASFNLA